MAGTGVAASSIQSPGSFKNPKLQAVIDVDIDKNGKFKYILLKVHDPDKDREFKHIVRGYNKFDFHADIYDDAAPNIEARGLDCEIVGGGRLHKDHSKKTIHIFGYSQAYGRADHRITAALLQRKFHEYENITWSNDGY